MRNVKNLTVAYNALRKSIEETTNFVKDFQPQNSNEYFDRDLMIIQLNQMQSLAGVYAARINLSTVNEEIEESPIMENEPSVND